MPAISTDDLRIKEIRSIIAPEILMRELPASEEMAAFVTEKRQAAARCLHGADDRLLVIAGPCSIHDRTQAIDYATRLREQSTIHQEDLSILMRVYFEKPRTTVGWKGYINDPDLDGTCEIDRGIRLARELLLKLNATGVACATEFLDVITPQYIADLVAWGAIGARTTGEPGSPPARLRAFHAGRIQNMAPTATSRSLSTPSVPLAARTTFSRSPSRGSPPSSRLPATTTATLSSEAGVTRTTVPKTSIPPLTDLTAAGLPALGHGRLQPRQLPERTRQPTARLRYSGLTDRRWSSEVSQGSMIESHLVAGSQSLAPVADLTYGQSITDSCVDWETTKGMLATLAQAVQQRRLT